MGGSRRRLKKTQPKVKVGVLKRKKNQKTKLPVEVTEQRHDVEKRLHKTLEWTEQQTLQENYKKTGLVLDPNARFGRNQKSDPIKSREQRIAEDGETYSDDDEQRAACNQERKSGKAPPPRLTTQQRQIITGLIGKHKDDIEAMVWDTKLNPMQHSAGKLKKMIEGLHHWAKYDNARHDFRAPNKPYKRL